MNVEAILAIMTGYVPMVFLTTSANVYPAGLEPCVKPVCDALSEMLIYHVSTKSINCYFIVKEIC